MADIKRVEIAGRSVNAVGLGCMGYSHASGEPMERGEAVRTLRLAHEIGYELFDTAECYTGVNPDGSISYNEALVGEALEPVRDEVFICTKFGVTHGEGAGNLTCDSRPETIRRSIEGSLAKLHTDHVDLYYQHRVDPEVEPEVVAGVMAELIAEGKVLAWGISACDEAYLRRAHAVCPVSAVENRYSMMDRASEALFGALDELGVAFVAYSPMGKGFLTGAYTAADAQKMSDLDYRKAMYQYTEEGQAAYAELSGLVARVAAV